MEISLYPDNSFDENKSNLCENESGSFNKFFKNLKKEYPALFALTRNTLKDVKKADDLSLWENNKRAGRLKWVKEPIWEFRIPPTRSGGVVRLYFGYDKHNKRKIHILQAEVKHDTEANPEKVKSAIDRFKEVCK
jgi:hypothetical protein